jgi:hypothetical protein
VGEEEGFCAYGLLEFCDSNGVCLSTCMSVGPFGQAYFPEKKKKKKKKFGKYEWDTQSELLKSYEMTPLMIIINWEEFEF